MQSFSLISCSLFAILFGSGCGDSAGLSADLAPPADLALPDFAPPADVALPALPDWPPGGPVSFTTVALPGMAANGAVASCLIFTDLDGDDRPDLFFVHAADGYTQVNTGYVLKNLDGEHWEEHPFPFKTIPIAMECIAGDIDNDGLPEIFITGLNSSTLLKNNGAMKFSDVTTEAGFGGPDDLARSGAFLDYDADGKLDLYLETVASSAQGVLDKSQVACTVMPHFIHCYYPVDSGKMQPETRLYRNTDGAHFSLVANTGLTNVPNKGLPNAVGIADWNFDGYPDIFDCNDFYGNHAYQNLGNGKFLDVTSMLGQGDFNNAMGVAFADYNGDGKLDFYLAELANNQLWMADAAPNAMPTHTNRADPIGTESVTRLHSDWGPSAADFNQDGWIDVFVPSSAVVDKTDDFVTLMKGFNVPAAATQEDTVFVNSGEARAFSVQHVAHQPKHMASFTIAGSATADFDGDGQLDVAEVFGPWPICYLRLLHNDTPTHGHALRVKLVGRTSNRLAVGATVTVTVQGQTQVRQVQSSPGSLSSPSPMVHFGLNQWAYADHLTVTWPGGKKQEVAGPIAIDKVLVVTEQ